MAQYMIDSNDAAGDKQDLANCRDKLYDAKQKLYRLCTALSQSDSQAKWEGQAKWKFYELLESFAQQVDELIQKNDLTVQNLDNIANTFKEYDRASGNYSSGGGR